eukprot:jgi/Mesen1/10889/ME000935S10227
MSLSSVPSPTPAEPAARPTSDSSQLKQRYDFRIVEEHLTHSRYLNVFNRIVEHPAHVCNGHVAAAERTIQYDVVGARTQTCHFCCVVPFHSRTKTVTLLSEYAQGVNQLAYTVPCGGFSESHASLEDCAMKELSEEARLRNGRLVKLVDDQHPGLIEVKWCKNRFTPFLVIDPEHDSDPRPRDLEEFIEIHHVTIPELKKIMYSGDMMLPSVVTCAMAIEYLQEDGLL